jgi:hypothetical protein
MEDCIAQLLIVRQHVTKHCYKFLEEMSLFEVFFEDFVLVLFYVYKCVTCMYACAPLACGTHRG